MFGGCGGGLSRAAILLESVVEATLLTGNDDEDSTEVITSEHKTIEYKARIYAHIQYGCNTAGVGGGAQNNMIYDKYLC